MRAETKGQARADHGPDQQHVRMNLRDEPGSPGTWLRLVISRKQKFILQKNPGKQRLPTSEQNPLVTD